MEENKVIDINGRLNRKVFEDFLKTIVRLAEEGKVKITIPEPIRMDTDD